MKEREMKVVMKKGEEAKGRTLKRKEGVVRKKSMKMKIGGGRKKRKKRKGREEKKGYKLKGK